MYWITLAVVLLFLRGSSCALNASVRIENTSILSVSEQWKSTECRNYYARGFEAAFEDIASCTGYQDFENPIFNYESSGDWNMYPCAQNNADVRSNLQSAAFVISHKFKLIYIVNYKVMSTSIRVRLSRLYDISPEFISPELFPRDIDLSEYFIFSFVRNPLTKYVSATNQYWQHWKQPMKDQIGLSAMLKYGYVVDGHFRSQIKNLALFDQNGNQVMLNFIGRLENVKQDWEYIVRQISLRNEEQSTVIGASRSSSTSKDELPQKNNTRLKEAEIILDDEFWKNYCYIYGQDYSCLGYELPPQCK